MNRVLLLGGDTRALYALISFFNAKGVSVYIGDCGIRSVLSATKLANYVYLPTLVKGDCQQYEEEPFITACLKFDFDVIYPVTDQAYWKLNNAKFSNSITSKVIAYSSEQYTNLSDKAIVQPVASKCFDSPALVSQIEPEETYIVKDRNSFDANNVSNRGCVKKLKGKDIGANLGGKLIFEYVKGGTGVGIGIIARNGYVKAIAGHARVYENNLAGSAIRKPLSVPKDIENKIRAFALELSLDGLNMIEFKLYNGKWYFIELNPRPWGSLPLYLAGYVFSNQLASYFSLSYEDDIKQVRNSNLIHINLVKSLRNQPRFLIRLLPKLLLGKVSFDEISAKENLFFSYVRLKLKAAMRFRLFQFKQILTKRNCNSSLSGSTFVCFGNINRSALAELHGRNLGLQVFSCGTIEKSGRNRSEQLISYLHKENIDCIGSSSSFRINDNKFVLFDRLTFEDMVFKLNVGHHKMELLSLRQIKDPHNKNPKVYLSTYRRIRTLITK